MADPRGFLKVRTREDRPKRPVPVRLMDWKEVQQRQEAGTLHEQAGRCMDCGVPFCHQGCPLGNLIPEWNDLVWREQWAEASERMHATNNFPEFTGRVCPAPCESSCVLGINQPPVTIKQVEYAIGEKAFDDDLITPYIPQRLVGKTVAVVGSGPAGLAAAQQLTQAGFTVAVYERDDAIGGLLRYGIPDFKLEKSVLERRLEIMRQEGTKFRAGVEIGRDITWDVLRRRYDAVIVATGATRPRDLDIPGRELDGVHYAMDYLVRSNKRVAGQDVPDLIDAKGKNVIVLGGGDTGSDCIGTALRQGAASVTSLAIGRKPPVDRADEEPWPMMPRVFEVSTSHEEGGERTYLASTVEFVGDEQGRLTGLKVAETQYREDGSRVPAPGTEKVLPADLVFLALGFTGNESDELTEQLPVSLDRRRNVDRDETYMTAVDGVFSCGDAGRGQSLVVWAIAEGRACAAHVERHLTGQTRLPEPVEPSERAIDLSV
ncbi:MULTISPECIES: glutamate synthase subunit beta [unclassified Kocuria]|uniref:glutamate synthase subunit beta n=1 Tax=unclassified Kocuria TaxID=2649579 RepID=UPI000F884A8C|nr:MULTISPECIES: glutamate synthase subunit beta [unclassified Kocuria]RUP84905.1 glutamate synthase subunit beta [Kocuria sp. HSID17590]RUQ10776.1 glutamate synthase subunit beta [Kocuria sp. HSID17582]